MKSLNIIFIGFSITLAACNSSKKPNDKEDTVKVVENGVDRIVDAKYLLVPGRSVGEISLGDDMQEVFKLLGKPGGGDAAMGKAWSVWFGNGNADKTKSEFAIYSSYRDSNMVVKDVKQIRVSDERFKTQDGFGTGRFLKDAQVKFPSLIKKAIYINDLKDTMYVYDSKLDGIAFEFLKDKASVIIIHPKNEVLADTYLTLHPEWKLVE